MVTHIKERGITYRKDRTKQLNRFVTIDLDKYSNNTAFEDFLDGAEAESAKTTTGRSWDLAVSYLDKIHGL
ncbi:MAG: hypothetical protein LBN95_12740 [Prevotellaceae bacterium]|jgi:hypothetical protein|nr:hypothetical protein [Prevotellaceae bacterium]